MPINSQKPNLRITPAERRVLGRYDTPRPLAQAVSDWAVRTSSDRVLEPSSGGGVFVQSIFARLKELGGKGSSDQVFACDIDERALNQTLKSIGANHAKLIHGDFLQTSHHDYSGTDFDAIIGNPPYVRLHTMSAAARAAARQTLSDPHLLDAKAGLWAYFPIHGLNFLKPGGRMAWILPETLLHSNYGRQLLNWSSSNFERCIALSLRERCFQIDGAKERVVILLLEGANVGSCNSPVELKEFATVKDCISGISMLRQAIYPCLPALNGHAVPHLISTEASISSSILELDRHFTRFGDLATIRIGVVTGDNAFFVLSEEQRIQARLARRHFKPIVSKFSHLGRGFDLPDPEDEAGNTSLIRNLLLCPNPNSKDQRLRYYLDRYSKEKIEANRTMAKRSYWQCPILGDPPDAFLRCMGQTGPRLVLNVSKSFCTNTIHAVSFKTGLKVTERRGICLSMHSTYSQLSAEFEGRQYGSGVLKIEPSEAKRLRVHSSKTVLAALGKRWKDLSNQARKLGWESVVSAIDQIIIQHDPLLAKTLPIIEAQKILERVRKRRIGIRL